MSFLFINGSSSTQSIDWFGSYGIMGQSCNITNTYYYYNNFNYFQHMIFSKHWSPIGIHLPFFVINCAAAALVSLLKDLPSA